MTPTQQDLYVLIVDDEPLARAKLQAMLAKCHDHAIARVIEATNGEHALVAAEGCPVNVALLDVQMPGMSGITLARELRSRYKHLALVFVTAYEDYAFGAFEVEAADYLTKPVRQERLEAALARAARWLAAVASSSAADADEPHIVVRERGAVLRVLLSSIVYFKAEMKYTTIRTAEREYVIEQPLSELEAAYPDRFIRVHRNALVANNAIVSLVKHATPDDDSGEGWVIHVRGLPDTLAVSRRQLTEVRARVKAG
jgi:two-component system, LytTR family, response regulator AlgR